MDSAKVWVEIIGAATMPVGVIAITLNRILTKKGLSVRAIQFMGLNFFVPLLLILGLEGILDGSAIGALLGAFVGYLFSNIGKYDEKKYGSTSE